jgi:transposase
MSLQPGLIPPVPEDNAQIALAAFPDGHPYLRLRDQLGNLFTDANFADLDPPGASPRSRPGGWP